jgi:hypothetical protein
MCPPLLAIKSWPISNHIIAKRLVVSTGGKSSDALYWVEWQSLCRIQLLHGEQLKKQEAEMSLHASDVIVPVEHVVTCGAIDAG